MRNAISRSLYNRFFPCSFSPLHTKHSSRGKYGCLIAIKECERRRFSQQKFICLMPNEERTTIKGWKLQMEKRTYTLVRVYTSIHPRRIENISKLKGQNRRTHFPTISITPFCHCCEKWNYWKFVCQFSSIPTRIHLCISAALPIWKTAWIYYFEFLWAVNFTYRTRNIHNFCSSTLEVSVKIYRLCKNPW